MQARRMQAARWWRHRNDVNMVRNERHYPRPCSHPYAHRHLWPLVGCQEAYLAVEVESLAVVELEARLVARGVASLVANLGKA